MRAFLKRYPIASFCVLAFLLSWSISVPLALKAHGLISLPLPMWLHYITAYGPMIAAMFFECEPSRARASVVAYDAHLRPWQYIKVCIIAWSPAIVLAIALTIQVLLERDFLSIDSLSTLNYLPPQPVVWAGVIWIATFGLGEEYGWRGFLLRRLQEKYSPLVSTVIVFLIWSAWHTPYFFYLFEISILPGWIVGLFCGCVFLTWLFNFAGQRIWVVAVWHGTFNLISAADHGKSIVAIFSSVVVMIVAVLLLFTGRLSRTASSAHR